MDLRSLSLFVEVVRRNGFTEAARVVHATQSTVSKSVKQLEDSLGVQLLDRSGHRVALTSAGEIVYRHALSLLAQRDDMLTALDALHGRKRGQLRLGLPTIGADLLFAPVFAAYHRHYPGIGLHLVEGGCTDLETRLRAGAVELAGLLAPVPEEFEWRRIRREPIVALISRNHPLAEAGSAPLEALRDTPFVLFDEGFTMNRIVREGCARAGFAPNVAAQSSQVGFIVELAASGLGVGFLPRLIANMHAGDDTAQLALPDAGMMWDMGLAWRRGAYLSQAATAWVELATA